MGRGDIRRRQKVQSSGDSEATKAKTPGTSEAQQQTQIMRSEGNLRPALIPPVRCAIARDELRLRLQCTMRFAEHYTGQQTANRVAIGPTRPAASSLRYVCADQKNHAGDRCVPTSRTFTLHPEWM